MGCAQSRVDNEEAVSRCKERRNLMKEAVVARNAFAAGHTGFAMALKNTGAALSDYGHGESDGNYQNVIDSHSVPPPPPPLPMDTLLPPPPLPNFSPSPLKRATSMPEFAAGGKAGKAMASGSEAIAEEGEEEEEEEDEDRGTLHHLRRRRRSGGADLDNGAARPEVAPRPAETVPVPPMPESKGMAWDYFFAVENMPGPGLGGVEEEEVEEEEEEEEGEEIGNENNEVNRNVGFGDSGTVGKESGGLEINGGEEMEPKTPEKVVVNRAERVQIEHSNTVPADFTRVVKAVSGPSVSLMKVLGEIDDHFLKASQSAQEVSKMLEATRLHYHSNFADNRGHIDHSARVMRVITWNKSFRGLPNGDLGKDDFDADEYETHATVLDKLLAWEKKLYEEVKQGELMKLEYQRKVSLLNRQKKRGSGNESLEKTKAAVSHLHTRYIVDMQSMDSTASEINNIRDEQLYPRLVLLVEGMDEMWKSMCIHHDSQLKLVSDLKSLDISHAPKETTKHHHERTIQLQKVINDWHSQFDKLVSHQKQYIRALNSWLKLNLVPIESNLKEKISSPPRPVNPPIQALILSWYDYLEKLPDEIARSAITSFAAVINTIILHQEEEMKLKDKCEETRKEFLRKNQGFEDWYQKHIQRRGSSMDEETATPNDPVVERQAVVESLKKRLEEEVEAHQRHCVQVREKSLGSLKIRLPELFRAMSQYSHACSDAYGKLRSLTETKK